MMHCAASNKKDSWFMPCTGIKGGWVYVNSFYNCAVSP